MDTLLIALVVAVVGPLLLSYLNAKQNRKAKKEDNEQRLKEKLEDYERQDKVAERAAQAAKDLYEAQQEGIRRTDEVARLAADAATMTTGQLKEIHTLVNSNMTAAMQGQQTSLKAQLVLLKRAIAADEAAGRQPTQDDLAAVKSVEAQIAELEAALVDRLKQTRVAEAEKALEARKREV